MADFEFNITKGQTVANFLRVDGNDPAASGVIVVMLDTAEADSVLVDYDDLDTLLTAVGNVEATYTGYSRTTWTDTELTIDTTPDDTNDYWEIDVPDIVHSSASGTEPIKLIMCYAPNTAGADSTFVPMLAFDISIVFDGTDATFTPASGTVCYRAL
jgi:hypothetical protein